MHRDRRLVVEGHALLPVGVIFVHLQVQDRCRFRLVRSAEGLPQERQEVCALRVWPGHGLQCGGLGRVVGDRGLVEDVDAGVGWGPVVVGAARVRPGPRQASRRPMTP